MCNGGTDADTFDCNLACGQTYESSKPVAPGGIWNTYWENDTQVCKAQPPPTCPLTYSMKKTDTDCLKRNVPPAPP